MRRSPEHAGRLAAVLLAVGGGRALLALLLQGPDLGVARLALGYATLALLAWRLPWSRMGGNATLLIAPPALLLVAVTFALGLVPDRASSVPLLVLFGWVGVSHPRWCSLVLLPVAGAAYAVPPVLAGEAFDGRALLLTLGGCVLVAEVIAYAMDVAVRSTRRAERTAHAFGVVARAGAELHHLDPAKVLEAVADAVLELGYDGANLAMLDPERRTFQPMHVRAAVAPLAHTSFPLEQGTTGEAWRTRAPVVVPDYQRSPLAVARIRETGVRTVIAVPVFRGSDVVAVLHASSLQQREVLAEEVEALRILATTAGSALQNAHDFLAERTSAERHAAASLTDPLTGVGNRRRAHQVLAELQTGDTVVMIDLDRFKDVNDRLGHAAGDQVLRQLAAHLETGVRESDRVLRLGGEEFLVVLAGAHQDEAEATVQRLLHGWRLRDPLTTFSAGLASHDGGTAEGTLERADQALYAAKGAGRDTWCSVGRSGKRRWPEARVLRPA